MNSISTIKAREHPQLTEKNISREQHNKFSSVRNYHQCYTKLTTSHKTKCLIYITSIKLHNLLSNKNK